MRHHPKEPLIPRTAAHDPLQCYYRLVAAFLQRVVWDAQDQPHGAVAYSKDHRRMVQGEAIAFLRDTEAVAFWCELAGANAEQLIPALWRQAGIEA